MFDPSAPDKLTAVAKHWIAGLLKHARAISAFAAPTVNCYRRFFLPWCPNMITWGLNDRQTLYRVRAADPDHTLVEGRIGCSASNPYLLMAAHIAAGIDGIKNKLECPPPSPKTADIVPKTLTEALEALEADKVMTEALGPQLIEWFCQCKREIDIKELADSDVSVLDEVALKKERDMYEMV